MTAPFPHHYRVALRWKGNRDAAASAPPRPELACGSPPEFDGNDRAWSPEHLLLSSASLCLMLTFLALADKAKIKLESYRCETEGVLDKTPEGLIFTRIVVGVALKSPEQERAEALLRTAKKYCIVSNSLKAPIEIEKLAA